MIVNIFDIDITTEDGKKTKDKAIDVANLVFACENWQMKNRWANFKIEKWGQTLEGKFADFPDIRGEIEKRWRFLSVSQVAQLASADDSGVRQSLRVGRLRGVKLGDVWLVETDSAIKYYQLNDDERRWRPKG
jgi:hypothetical protein